MAGNANENASLATLEGPELRLRFAVFDTRPQQSNSVWVASECPVAFIVPSDRFEVSQNGVPGAGAKIDLQFTMPVANLAAQCGEADTLRHFLLLAAAVDSPVDI